MSTPSPAQQPWSWQPPPHGNPYPGYLYPPRQPPKKKPLWPWVAFFLFGVFVLGAVGCVALISHVSNDIAETGSVGAGETAPAGSEVSDGKFTFQVTGVDAPTTTVGDNPYSRQTAQGQFLIVRVNVANTGSEQRGYFGENQKLIDAQGRQFSNNTGAELALNDNAIIGEINPGNKVTTAIVFDVPPGTTPTAIEFHDSAFSNGARVALS